MPLEPNEKEPVNLLALDGGGVRGVSSLLILHKIMVQIQINYGLAEVPKPCEVFHMIAGTSTGGLIAIMLGRLRMSTEEALKEYDQCASKIFSFKNRKKLGISSRYRARALRRVIEDLVKRRDMGELMRDPECPEKGKCFVCVMPSARIAEPRLVHSFKTDAGSLGDNWDEHITIWQAARATTAASTFFKPQRLGLGPDSGLFIDAAIGANNPIGYLLKEAVEEFGSARRLGCIVSIGTGTRNIKLRGDLTGPRYVIELLKTLKNNATDGEKTHRELEERLAGFPDVYFRFNVPQAAETVGLDKYKKMPRLKDMTTKYLSEELIASRVERVAGRLKTDTLHGLTLGLICMEPVIGALRDVYTNRDADGLDKNQMYLSNIAQEMGVPSNFFTGRQDILEKLDSFFSPRDTEQKPRREFLLHGMGGVGKTEIALKTAENLEKRFEYIFYIHASSAATIAQSYADIASTYGLGGGTVEELRNKAMRWIEGLPAEWLMIFDNWALSERRGHIPGRNKGNIIYTSRSSELCKDLPSECVYEVTPFGEADAVNLLLRASDTNAETPEDRVLAEAIVQELGYLPLAIGNAAASIKESRYPLHKYLKRIRDEKVSIRSNPRFGKEKEKVENWTVYASLELSYEDIINRRRQAGRDGPGLAAIAALKVLNLLCFYHPTSIKLAILGNAAHEYHKFVRPDLSSLVRPNDPDLDRLVGLTVDGLWSGRFITSGLNLLRKFHLVKVDNDFQTISMHDLIHAWARHRMENEAVSKWGLVAKVLLIESIPVEDPLKSNTLLVQRYTRSLQPHFDMCLKNSEPPRIPFCPEYESFLLGKLALYYRTEHDFEKAKKCLLERLHIEKMQCMGNIIVVITLIELGQLNHEMGCLGEAELMFLTAIEILRWEYERVTDGERVSRLKNRFLRVCANHIPSLTQTLSMHARISGGVLFESVSDSPKESLKGKERAASMESQNPLDIPENYIAMSNFIHGELGRVYMDQGRYGMGRRMLCQAVENLGRFLDYTDPRYLRLLVYARCETDYDNVEFWGEYLKKLLEAAPNEELTREGTKPTMSIHASPALCEGQIAQAFSIVAKYPEYWEMAFDLLEKFYPFFTKSYGINHCIVLKTMRHQVHCLIEGLQYDRAVDLAKRCLERAKEGYGEFHMETFKAQEILSRALFYQRMGADEENCAILQEAFEKSAVSLGLTHPTTKQIQRRLKRFLDGQESITRAVREDHYQQEFEESVISLGPNHPTTRLLQRMLDSMSNPASEDMTRPETLRELNKEILAECILGWHKFKQQLAEIRAAERPNRQLLHVFTHLVGNGPPRSPAENLERYRAAFGPNDQQVKWLEKIYEERLAVEARIARDGWWPSRKFWEARSLGEEGAQVRPVQATKMTAVSSMTAKRRKASDVGLDHVGIAVGSQESLPEEIVDDNELGEDIAGEKATQAIASAVAGELVGESSGTQR